MSDTELKLLLKAIIVELREMNHTLELVRRGIG
jgi:hypothetical protein